MYYKISELGYNPVMIGTKAYNNNISFIQNAIKIRIIQKNFSEIKENDYDILMVNSDQTWRKWDKHFYDIAFLKFSENWNKYKFIYMEHLQAMIVGNLIKQLKTLHDHY